MNENDIPRQVERELIEKGGYVPVTPLGPPPQGEPLFSQYPSQPQAARVDSPQADTTSVQPQTSTSQQAP